MLTIIMISLAKMVTVNGDVSTSLPSTPAVKAEAGEGGSAAVKISGDASTESNGTSVGIDAEASGSGSSVDVSIGTGGMTLPLQELNIEIFGSDLSREMLSRCKEKAMKKNRPVRLECCDFRDLSCWGDLKFDCVASTGNAWDMFPIQMC